MRRRTLAVALLAAAFLTVSAGSAAAHPLGNFTINTSTTITVTPGGVHLAYVVDMAEIPTFQALERIDADEDGEASPEELASWSTDQAAVLLRGFNLWIDGADVALEPEAAQAALAPGQGGLSVLRLETVFRTTVDDRGEVAFADRNFPGRIGWREIVVTGRDGEAVISSSAPATSPSDTLRSYPNDLLSSPPKVLRATFAYAPGVSAPVAATVSGPTSARAVGGGGALAGLIARGDLTLAAFALALLAAFGLGAVHAIGPGHGKTLMAAYVVDRRGGVRQAALVGVTVAVMHTASVLALGVVVLAVERLAPERVYPWLTALSGLTALALGSALLFSRLRRLRAGTDVHPHDHRHDGEHAEDHGHEHPHGEPAGERVLSRRGLFAIAFAGGILPSPSALLALLASFALGRTAFGLVLVAAFSVGLAATLSVVAIAVVRARDAIELRMRGRFTRLLPVASAAVIFAIGLTVTIRAVTEL